MRGARDAGDDRDEWQQAERVVTALGLAPGQKIADLGAGGGYFSFRLAEAVGPTGKLYALDIDEEMNERLEALAAERGAPYAIVNRGDTEHDGMPQVTLRLRAIPQDDGDGEADYRFPRRRPLGLRVQPGEDLREPESEDLVLSAWAGADGDALIMDVPRWLTILEAAPSRAPGRLGRPRTKSAATPGR